MSAGSKTDPAKKYWWALGIGVPVLVALIGIVPPLLKKESKDPPGISITRDSHDLNFQPVTVIEAEYRTKTGQQLPPELKQQIDQALQLMKQQRYGDGIPLLRAALEKAPVPSVMTDLGHALAITGNSTEAQTLYNQAATADPSNKQVAEGKQFLSMLAGNNTILTAAEIPVQKPVATTVPDGGVDFFKFTAPAGPRDILRVRLRNRSTTLAPGVNVMNADKAPVGGTSGAAAADVAYEFPATPGAVHYVRVAPNFSGGGAYTLTVEPTHSFDSYEPNDTILTAKDISGGGPFEANIMDGNDTDFYRFRARAVKTTIVIENRSTTLGIWLAVTNADKAPVGSTSGPVAANVRYTFDSTPGSAFQLQISPYFSGGGKYAFTIQ